MVSVQQRTADAGTRAQSLSPLGGSPVCEDPARRARRAWIRSRPRAPGISASCPPRLVSARERSIALNLWIKCGIAFAGASLRLGSCIGTPTVYTHHRDPPRLPRANSPDLFLDIVASWKRLRSDGWLREARKKFTERVVKFSVRTYDFANENDVIVAKLIARLAQACCFLWAKKLF